MRVLVTGGAGFIGSAYVRAALAGEYGPAGPTAITVLDLLTYAGRRDNLPAHHDRLRFVRGDVRDAATLAEVVPGHDAVLHFAAESHVDRSVADADDFVSTNVLGTQRLLDACRRAGVRTVLCVSTDEVYGSIDVGAWSEEAPLAPNSPYAAAKAGAELLARAYHRTHGLDVRITRGCNTYGPHQNVEKFVPRFVTNLLSGEPAPLYGDGRNRREWLHVADHCAAIQLVLTAGAPGGVYNVGSGVESTNAELAARLVRLCAADPALVRHVTDRKGHDLRYSLDSARIATLGFRPRTDFAAGLAATVDWYRTHRDWWRPDR
jgi:dTDP-glucose 4,6-dehydratase